MKTNLFNVKKVKKEKITLEEEQFYSPLLLLFRKYGCLAVLFFFLLLLILTIIIIYTFANLFSSKEGDGSYVDDALAFEFGDNNVTITDGKYNDSWINKYANVYKKEGIIFVVKEFEVKGQVIIYYSDGSSKLVREDGSIVRISSLSDGSYGIDNNGVINTRTKRKGITITKKEDLKSGTVIIYYSDGSAEITKGEKTILVRNGKRINLKNNAYDLDDVSPSGASYVEKKEWVGDFELIYYTDGTIKIDKGNDSFIVRNSEDIKIEGNVISYPNNNQAKIIEILALKDGTKVTYYSDGSALIETFYNTEIMVRRSRDIVLKDKDSFYEILDGDIAFAIYTKTNPNGDEVTYYDDGSAVIRYSNGTSEYISENSNIKYDNNGNIKDIVKDVSIEKRVITTPDGTVITEFDNGKSRIEDNNGNDYIIDTEDVIIDPDGNLLIDENEINKYNPREDDEPDDPEDPEEPVDPDNPDDPEIPEEEDGEITGEIETISDNYYSFSISNMSKRSVNYKLVLEESINYDKYGYQYKVLPATHIRYDLIIGEKYFEGLNLSSNIWEFNDRTNYVLYEGTLNKKETLEGVTLYVYFDYADLDNSMQDRMFLGTIRLYIEEEVE